MPPVQIIHQYVPYAPRRVQKRFFTRFNESEVGFLDFVFFELDLKLASLETASSKEERAGRVLV